LFAPLAAELDSRETEIVTELNAVQGKPVDIGGYYHPSQDLVSAAMRPSAAFNAALASLNR
jgi:isocitrate dehydrogenase